MKKPVASDIRVLVVDDDDSILRATTRMLRNFGEITSCLGAHDAIELVRSGKDFDVVLSDVSMPGISGKAFLEAIQEFRPELAKKFIFLTGGGGATEELCDFIASRDFILMKPVSGMALFDMLQRVSGCEL